MRAMSLLQPVGYDRPDAGAPTASRSSSSMPATCSDRRTRAFASTARRILFGGDLGRFGRPVLPDPTMVAEADYLLVESTYGDRVHEHDDDGERCWQRSSRRPPSAAARSSSPRSRSAASKSCSTGSSASRRSGGSRCCRCSSTARWPSRRWRGTPSGCASSMPELQPEEPDDKAPHGPAARGESREPTPAARAPANVSSARSAPSASGPSSSPPSRKELTGVEDAGDRHLRERHGHRRPRPASSPGRAAGLAEHRAVRRLSRPTARAAVSWRTARRRSRSTGRSMPVHAQIETDRIDVGARRLERDPCAGSAASSARRDHLPRPWRAGGDGGALRLHQGQARLEHADAAAFGDDWAGIGSRLGAQGSGDRGSKISMHLPEP